MAATEALVFDAVRTPRGRGKVNGSLHATKPVDLVVGLMHETLARNSELDPNRIDDVVLGCRDPDRRPGRGHRQDRRDQGRPAPDRRRRPAQPLLRIGPGGGQHGRPEGRLRLGGPGAGGRRRVDVARADGLRRRRLGDGPGDQLRHVLRPAGHRRRPDRDRRGLHRARTWTPTPCARRSAPRPRRRPATSTSSVIPVVDFNGNVVLDHDEFIRRGTTVETLARAQAVVRDDGRARRVRRRRAAEVPLGRDHRPRAHAGQLLRDRGRRRAADDRQREDRRRARAEGRARASSPPP